jgi:hypothetical protein
VDEAQWSVTVGVTGHRFLGDEPAIAAGVDEALDEIGRSFGSTALTIVSPLAQGADQLVTRRALDRPATRLVAALPLPLADYLQDFRSRDALLALLDRADDVVELPRAAGRDQAYLAAGRYIVAHCDVLLAVWDGRPSRGPGGTADVVAAARRIGRPLACVWARNCAPGAVDGPVEREGTVSTERFPDALAAAA